MATLKPSIVRPCSCKRFSISELTYSPCLTIDGYLCRDRIYTNRDERLPQEQVENPKPPRFRGLKYRSSGPPSVRWHGWLPLSPGSAENHRLPYKRKAP